MGGSPDCSFLIVLYQVPLKIIVSAAFRWHLESEHIPSPPGRPIIPCLASHVVPLTTSITFPKDEAFETSWFSVTVRKPQSKQWSQRPYVFRFFSASKTVSQASLLSTLLALLHPTTSSFCFSLIRAQILLLQGLGTCFSLGPGFFSSHGPHSHFSNVREPSSDHIKTATLPLLPFTKP